MIFVKLKNHSPGFFQRNKETKMSRKPPANTDSMSPPYGSR